MGYFERGKRMDIPDNDIGIVNSTILFESAFTGCEADEITLQSCKIGIPLPIDEAMGSPDVIRVNVERVEVEPP